MGKTLKSGPAVLRPYATATPRRNGTHAIAAGTALFLCCAAQAQFVYDQGAWQPGMSIPTVPTVPIVPGVPLLPCASPCATTPVVTVPVVTPPSIQSDVILTLTPTTISGCLDSGKVCVFGLPVQVVGKVATGKWNAARFEFKLP